MTNLGALVLAVVAAACHTKDPCETGVPACGDGGLVVCGDAGPRLIQCRGPAGCVGRDGGASCDRSLASEGDACEGGESACTLDRTRLLSCDRGVLAVKSECRGPDACRVSDGTHVLCDATVGDPGDACASTGLACDRDGQRLLACRGGKLVVNGPCRGPDRCKATGGEVSCDRSIATAGDPCDGDGYACSEDHASMLRCKQGRFVAAGPCHCRVVDKTISCR